MTNRKCFSLLFTFMLIFFAFMVSSGAEEEAAASYRILSLPGNFALYYH